MKKGSYRVSVLINNYNYQDFVLEAIASVRSQTYENIETIIVDDGSVDDSVERIKEYIEGFPDERLIVQENGGQLSAFRAGVKMACGEIICFLDADDLYMPNHVKRVVEIFHTESNVGTVFCKHRASNGSQKLLFRKGKGYLGPSAALVCFLRLYIGSMTSSLAMRKDVTEFSLPLPKTFDKDWRISGDMCLVFGSSFHGSGKYYLDEEGFVYRIHGENNYTNKVRDRYAKYLVSLKIERLCDYYAKERGLTPPSVSLLVKEFNAIPNPSRYYYKAYCQALRVTPLNVFYYIRLRWRLFRLFYKTRLTRCQN